MGHHVPCGIRSVQKKEAVLIDRPLKFRLRGCRIHPALEMSETNSSRGTGREK